MEAIIFIVLFLVLAIGTLVGIWRELRNSRTPEPSTLDKIPPRPLRDPEDENFFRISLIVILGAALYVMIVPDSHSANTVPQTQPIVVDLADCPAMTKGMTPVVMFIIDTTAINHNRPMSVYCSRMAKRSYAAVPMKKGRQ